jgi:hypothetical protein
VKRDKSFSKKQVNLLNDTSRKMTKIEIGSKWKHKNSNDVYVIMEQYSHRVVLKHELTGTTIKLTLGHLNPDGFADYERV